MISIASAIKELWANKSKEEICYNLLYVAGWLIGLFFSAYSFLFFTNQCAWTEFKSTLEPENIVKKYVYPMILMMLLFHWDTIYASWQESGRTLSVSVILLMVSAFFVGFLICLMAQCIIWKVLGFIFAWLCLGLLKGYTVFNVVKIRYGIEPDNSSF